MRTPTGTNALIVVPKATWWLVHHESCAWLGYMERQSKRNVWNIPLSYGFPFRSSFISILVDRKPNSFTLKQNKQKTLVLFRTNGDNFRMSLRLATHTLSFPIGQLHYFAGISIVRSHFLKHHLIKTAALSCRMSTKMGHFCNWSHKLKREKTTTHSLDRIQQKKNAID